MTDEIDTAQERVDADTRRVIEERTRYTGEPATHCVDCDAPIPEPRRQAIPGVQRCIECQGIVERYSNG